MQTRILTLLPALALTAGLSASLPACGEAEPGIPTSYHRTTGSSGGTGAPPAATGSSGGNADNGSSTGSSGATSGSSTSSSGSGSSSGTTGGSGAGSTSSTGGSTSSGSQPTGSLAVTLSEMAVSMQLLASTTVTVSVAPNGYSGTVDLTAGSMPAGITAAFDKPTLTLDGETTGTATLTITTATNAAPGNAPLAVSAAVSGGANVSTAVALTVESTITLHIPAGVNNTGASISNPNTTAYGPYPVTIVAPAGISASNPVTVYFMNDDTISHEIHADDEAQGFGHDPGAFGAGKMDPYVRKVNAAGTYDFYLHDQGAPITPGRVFIQASQ